MSRGQTASFSLSLGSSLYKSLHSRICMYHLGTRLHCQRDIQHIEAIQRRAARFTMNRYGRYESVTNMLHQLDWPTLYVRRNQLKLMMYKIINGLVYVQHSLPLTYSNLHSTLRGHSYKLSQPATRVDSYKFSFFSINYYYMEQFTIISAG